MRAACDAFEDRQLIADTRLRAAMGAQHLQYLKDECQLTRDVLDRATCLLFDSARANGRIPRSLPREAVDGSRRDVATRAAAWVARPT